MIRSIAGAVLIMVMNLPNLSAQGEDHVRSESSKDLTSLYQKLYQGYTDKDSSAIFDASENLLVHYTALGNWDSIYYYNDVVAMSALAIGNYEFHLKSFINNVSMDQMFRRSSESLPARFDHLQSILQQGLASPDMQSELANMIAGKYYRSGEVDSVYHYQKMAIRYADIKDNHQKKRLVYRIQMANYYREFGRVADALKNLIEIESELENGLLPAMQKISFYRGMVECLIDINDLSRVDYYLDKLRYIIDENGYKSQLRVYYELSGRLDLKKGKYGDATRSFHKGIAVSRRTNRLDDITSNWSRLANAYYRLNKIDSMKMYTDSIGAYMPEMNDRFKMRYNGLMTRYLMAKNDMLGAYPFLKEINENYTHVKSSEASIALLNREYYEEKKDIKNAYLYSRKYEKIRDSLDQAANAVQAKIIETRYNRDMQDAEITLLAATNTAQDKALAVRNNTILLGGIMLAALSLLLFGLYMLYKRNKESQRLLAIQNEKITDALERNQILIKEIHHRVKNNLQVVSSLLSLQERKVDDDATKEALKSSQTRVQTMSLIHKSLYQKDDVRTVDIPSYFTQLVENLVSSFALREVNLKLDIDQIKIDIDSLVPLGLVTNELVCNALKHGLVDVDDAQLSVSLKNLGSKIVLSVVDNGGKLGGDQLIRKEGSLGTRLIQAFTSNLEGELKVEGGTNTSISLTVDKDKIIFVD